MKNKIDNLTNIKEKTQQTQQSIKKPKALDIGRRKEHFIAVLKANGGNVSKALATANLDRRTAYEHLKNDLEFGEAWIAAIEEGQDELYAEARRRAIEGDIKYSNVGGKRVKQIERSDTLLIYLLKHGEAQKKWRGRVIQAGNIALETVRSAGAKLGLSHSQIEAIQDEMNEAFGNVSLI